MFAAGAAAIATTITTTTRPENSLERPTRWSATAGPLLRPGTFIGESLAVGLTPAPVQ